jgi:hypothetical protein
MLSSGPFYLNAPKGIRTPVLGLKGLRPSPLDDGGIYSGGILSSCPYGVKRGKRLFEWRPSGRLWIRNREKNHLNGAIHLLMSLP